MQTLLLAGLFLAHAAVTGAFGLVPAVLPIRSCSPLGNVARSILRLGAGSNGEADTTPSGAGEFRPGKSRYEAYYSQGQGEDGTDGAIDVPAEDDVSELPPRPTNPFFVGYDDDELNAVWSVHAKLYGAREDAPADAPDPSFLPSPAAPALEPEVRSQLQAGAQQRKQQLEAFQQAAGCSEKQSGDQGEKQSGDQGQGRRKRKGWGK